MYNPIQGTGDGSAPVVPITFPYISKAHVKALVDGVAATFTWTGASEVTFDSTVANGAAWVVYRDTPINDPMVDFTDGSFLTEVDLDLSQTQLLYRQQELQAASIDSNPTFGAVLHGELAAASGSGLVGWAAAGTGAVTRTLLDKLRDLSVSVKDYGAVGDGVADDTAAIQAAIDALPSGGRVYFPVGTYLLSAALNITAQGLHLEGAVRHLTVLRQGAANAKIINNSGNWFRLSGLRLDYAGAPVSGATALYSTGSYSHFHDFTVGNGYVNIELATGVAQKVTAFEALDYESVGVYLHDINDVFIDDFILNAGNTTRGALGGFRLVNKVEALAVSNGDVLMGVYGMTTDSATNLPNARPAYNRFTNVYFDSSANGVLVDKAVEFDFIGSWFSNRPGNGLALSNTDGMRFIGGGAINNGGHGVLVNATAKRTVFDGFASRGNSTVTANTKDGIAIAAGTTDFIITGGTLGGDIGFGTQRYGVWVDTGASDRYIIANNLVSGNGTGGVLDNGSGTNKSVEKNF